MQLWIIDLTKDFSNFIDCGHDPRVVEGGDYRKACSALPLWDMYSEALLSRFYEPVRAGDLSGSTSSGKQGNPTCGDVVEIAIRMNDGIIQQARFRTLGCAIAIAASDLICELAEGMTVTGAHVIDAPKISEALGGITAERWQCIAAPLAALQDALST